MKILSGRPALCLLAGTLLVTGCETTGGPGMNDVFGAIGGIQGTQGSGITAFEAEAGLREALVVGTARVVSQLGRADGYFGDSAIRIPLPGSLGEIQAQLQKVGLAAPLDDLQLRLNRAAESAVPAARTLIVDAVRSMTVEDAMGLLRGGDTAATDFLRRRTETQIAAAFRPYLEQSLASVGAFAALDSVTAQYGLTGVSASLQSSLIDHGVKYGLDGMFGYLAKEEQAIRRNPAQRTSEILRRVFGSMG